MLKEFDLFIRVVISFLTYLVDLRALSVESATDRPIGRYQTRDSHFHIDSSFGALARCT